MPDTPPNPSLDRRWLQVAGLPLPKDAAAVRAEFDRVARVDVVPNSSRIVLWGPDMELLGALDLQPPIKARIDQACERPAEEHKPDPSKGDTVIRPLDLTNPEHAAVLDGPRVIFDPAAEPPPLDLPGFEPAPAEPKPSWLDVLTLTTPTTRPWPMAYRMALLASLAVILIFIALALAKGN